LVTLVIGLVVPWYFFKIGPTVEKQDESLALLGKGLDKQNTSLKLLTNIGKFLPQRREITSKSAAIIRDAIANGPKSRPIRFSTHPNDQDSANLAIGLSKLFGESVTQM